MQNPANLNDHPPGNVVIVFRDRLRATMETQRLSCCALAKRSDVPEKTLRNILQGIAADPRLTTVFRIVAALGESANWMFGLETAADTLQRDTHAHMYDDLHRQLEQRDDEIRQLRTALAQKIAALSGKSECCESYIREVDRLKAEVKACKKIQRKTRNVACACAALFVLTLILIIYVLWDALHPQSGLIKR